MCTVYLMSTKSNEQVSGELGGRSLCGIGLVSGHRLEVAGSLFLCGMFRVI